MMRRRAASVLAAALALTLVAAGCGDDDDSETGSPSGSEAEVDEGGAEEPTSEASSSISVEMIDYGYDVSGSLTTGVQSFETTNAGEEIHMMAVGKLKDGVAIEDVQKALSQDGPPESGAEDEDADAATGQGGDDADEEATDESAGEGDAGEGEEEGEGGDPFEEFFEGEEIGTPGHILFPGESQTITLEDGLEPGTYAMLCFIPTEGEGVPHIAKGMVNTFEVVEEDGDAEPPVADVTYTLPDNAEPEGSTTLEAGTITFEATNDGDVGKDFFVGKLDEGKSFGDFDTFFTTIFEGDEPPPEGAAELAPGRIAGSMFEISPGDSAFLTLDLEPGTWLIVSATNNEGDDETADHFIEVTVE